MTFLRLSLWLLFVFLGGCVSKITMVGASCPCVDGFLCCPVVNFCIQHGSECPDVCGDKKITPPEECDDGDRNSDNAACSSSCAKAFCGDGFVLSGTEACDDVVESAGCNPDCTDARCGDNRLNTTAGEVCDDGNSVDGDYCNSKCVEITGYCGDEILQTNEVCDDGIEIVEPCVYGATSCLVCNSLCEEEPGLTSYCGDTFIDEEREECDPGLETALCNSDCTLSICGDGTLNVLAGEICDDGDSDTYDACKNDCSPAQCGDGVLRLDLELGESGYEACDDAGMSVSCLDDCTISFCGDSVTNDVAGEACDDGNQSNTDTCTNTCELARCGDEFIGPGEVCDDGFADACGTCNADCTAAGPGPELMTCGDGILCGEFEGCDDGNRLPADGCSGNCLVHSSFINAGYYHTCGLDIYSKSKCRGNDLSSNDSWLSPYFERQYGPLLLDGGNDFSCEVDGNPLPEIECAGSNDYGQSTPPQELPVISSNAGLEYFNPTKLSAGGFHACVIGEFSNSTLPLERRTICWGRNEYGERNIPEEMQLIDISAGHHHTCGIDTAGALHCWGAGGTGDPSNSAPHFGQSVPPSVGTFVRVAAGERHSCALNQEGTVHCWGEFPAELNGGLTAIDISIGTDTTCIVRPDTTLACWGNMNIASRIPTNLHGYESAVEGDFLQVSVGVDHACAAGIGGFYQVWFICWGHGSFLLQNYWLQVPW